MFCGKCGAENNENASFCVSCGEPLNGGPVADATVQEESVSEAPVNEEPVNAEPINQQPISPEPTNPEVADGSVVQPEGIFPNMNANNKNKQIGICVVAAAVVVVAVVLFIVFGGRSYKETISDLVEATEDADAEKLLGLLPDEVIEEEMKEKDFDDDEKEMFVQEMKKNLESAKESYGDDWDLDYEIKEVNDITGKDLKKIKDKYEEYDLEVSKAIEVEVKLTIEVNDKEDSDKDTLKLIKVGRNWYLDMNSIF